jgi:signal transduction histidine kinase
MTRRLVYPSTRLRLPHGTIRLRLTLLYGALFLASGAALLTVTYLLVEHQYTENGANLFVVTGHASGGVSVAVQQRAGAVAYGPGYLAPGLATPAQISADAHARSAVALNQLLINSGIALGIMALISIWLGWLVAGRALRPLRTIANTAREISATNLHRRLALQGPDDEITQLASTFDDLLARLEASFEAQRQFVANASHELRTPLTLERALVEVALADPAPSVASLREMGERVLTNGEYQERLIEALLTLSRSQRGLEHREPVDLRALTAESLRATDEADLTVVSELEPAWMTGDPRLLEHLVANLLMNAVRHNVPHGWVDVRTGTKAGRALLTVENTGETVPADQLDRLFQPFQRLDAGRTATSDGLGLGLSIAQAIAVAHHATITAVPRTGGGLRIEVGFLAHPPPRGAEKGPEPAQLAARASVGGTRTP